MLETLDDPNIDVWDIAQDIKQRIDHIISDRYDNPSREPLDKHYQDLLQYCVYQMTCLTVNREENYLDPMSDPNELKTAVNSIVGDLVAAFGVSRQQIEQDMKPYLGQYSVDDIRTSRNLRKDNKLH